MDHLDLELDVVTETVPPSGVDLRRLPSLARFVLEREGASGAWSVAVVFTDDGRLRALHRTFMGLDTETDVMTFPSSEPGRGVDAATGGDVVVSVERAAAQAADYGHSASEEVRFLVVHGLLHLCGWDDRTPDQRDRMLERQARLLAAFDALDRAAI